MFLLFHMLDFPLGLPRQISYEIIITSISINSLYIFEFNINSPVKVKVGLNGDKYILHYKVDNFHKLHLQYDRLTVNILTMILLHSVHNIYLQLDILLLSPFHLDHYHGLVQSNQMHQ